jgi:hypothetical protein
MGYKPGHLHLRGWTPRSVGLIRVIFFIWNPLECVWQWPEVLSMCTINIKKQRIPIYQQRVLFVTRRTGEMTERIERFVIKKRGALHCAWIQMKKESYLIIGTLGYGFMLNTIRLLSEHDKWHWRRVWRWSWLVGNYSIFLGTEQSL